MGRRNFEINLMFRGKDEDVICSGRDRDMLNWKDLVVILIIFAVSYWVAFVSGASKFIVQIKNNNPNKKKKPRGTIKGDEDKSAGSFIKRVQKSLIEKYHLFLV